MRSVASSGATVGKFRRRWLLAAAYACLIASCDNPVGPGQSEVGRVEVQPQVLNLEAGSTATLTSRAFDTGNREIVAHVFWSTQNAAVATVSNQGIVTAVAPGATQIAASAGGRSGFAAVTVSQRAVALVRLTPTAGEVLVAGTLQLIADVLDNAGAAIVGRPVTWSTSDAAIATVSTGGLVTGVAPGSATVRATADGIAGTAVITVSRVPVATVVITPPNASVQIGETRPLAATARDAAGNSLDGRVIVWSSSNDAVAAVSQSGVVTGVGSGIATITAAAPGAGVNGSTPAGTAGVSVVLVPVARVSVVPPTATVVIGGFATLTVSLVDANGGPLTTTGRTVSWTSSNTAIATVAGNGQVVAVAAGIATITAAVVTAGQSGSVLGTATVTVTNVPVASVQVTPSTLSLDVGATVTLSATPKDAAGNTLSGRAAIWSSSNTSVATVSSQGAVTGVAAGAATITATVDGTSGAATVTVTQVPVSTIVVAPNPATVQERTTTQLNAVARDANGAVLTGRTLVWSSSNNAVAAVSQAGLVTGIAPGNATVSATAIGGGPGGSSPSGSSAVSVSFAPIATVQVVPSSASVNVGGTTQFAVTLLDGTGQALSPTGRTVVWSSSDATKATVNSSTGAATGVALGSATITATASSPGQSPAVTSTAALTISSVPVATVTVSPSPATVHAGSPYARTFSAVTRDASNNILTGRAVVWTSNDQAVAQVDPGTGVVTGVAPGAVTITATSEGKSGTSSVTIDLAAVSSVLVAPPSATLSPQQTQQLTATPRDSATNAITGAALGGRTTAWTTNNAAVAIVNASGLVTAQGTAGGNATITATVGSAVGTSAITVQAAVNAVSMTASADSVIAPAQVTGTATVTNAASAPLSGRTIAFSSNAPAATVAPASGVSSAAGTVGYTVTGVSAGTATITASSETKTATVTIRVLNPVSTVTVSAPLDSLIGSGTVQAAATLRDAGSALLTGRPTTWSSSTPGVATVNATGLITAVSPGTTNITASSEGKTSTALIVRVLAAVNTITVTAPADSIIGSGTLQATATLRDASNNVLTGRPLTWSSSATGVATVNASTGLVTAVTPGSAGISANVEGKTGTLTVRVVVAVSSVTVTFPKDSLIGAGSIPGTVRLRDVANNPVVGRSVAIGSSSTAVATVAPATGVSDGNGEVAIAASFVSAGTASITATSGSAGGAATVRMLAPVATVTIAPTSATIAPLGSTTLTVTVTGAAAQPLAGRACTITSSTTAVATVAPANANTNASGQISLTVNAGLVPGSTTITATCEGKAGTSTITV